MRQAAGEGGRRIAWITGAGRGIGAAAALELARRGWTVAASARTEADLLALAARASRLAGCVEPWPLDVTDPDATARAVASIEGSLGPVGLGLLNAGTYLPTWGRELDTAPFRAQVELNIMGTIHGLAALAPRMRGRGQGRIGVVASLAGYRGLPGAAGYGATKAALIALCESLRPDLERDGVLLSVVVPGFVRTPLTDRNDFPMPFLMEPEDAARRIADGLEGRAFEIAMPRRLAWPMKAARLLPASLWFAVTRRLLR